MILITRVQDEIGPEALTTTMRATFTKDDTVLTDTVVEATRRATMTDGAPELEGGGFLTTATLEGVLRQAENEFLMATITSLEVQAIREGPRAESMIARTITKTLHTTSEAGEEETMKMQT